MVAELGRKLKGEGGRKGGREKWGQGKKEREREKRGK